VNERPDLAPPQKPAKARFMTDICLSITLCGTLPMAPSLTTWIQTGTVAPPLRYSYDVSRAKRLCNRRVRFRPWS
jgi:hypothetical protein